MRLFDVIKKHSEDLGCSVASIERRAGIGNGTIGRWNTSSPSIESLEKVSGVIGVEPWRLVKEAATQNKQKVEMK